MTVRVGYFTPYSGKAGETAQIKRDYIKRTSRLLIIPRQRERDIEAMKVSPVEFYLYKKISKGGRRCTCWFPTPDTSPKKECPNCWGTGSVPGYLKYGTKTEVIEPSRQNVVCNNVCPNWSSGIRPVAFTLLETATQGYVECDIHITTNIGVVDHLAATSDLDEGADITYYIKAPADEEWVPMTDAAVKERLSQNHIRFRIYLSRKSPNAYRPSLLNLYFRYQIANPVIEANIPRFTEAQTLADIGIEDSFGTLSMWLIDPVSSAVGNQDFFVRISDGTRWKVLDIQKFDPVDGVSLSADVQARFCQAYEHYHLIPE